MASAFQRLRQEVSAELRYYVVRYRRTQDDVYRSDLADRYIRCADTLLKYIVIWQYQAFYSLGVTQDDLLQWARVAAFEALHRYDLSRETDYSAYLVSYVKRYVYNKVLDELPVPRDVSKRIRRLLRDGLDPSEFPEHLRNAYHLRAPVTMDTLSMEGFGLCNDTERHQLDELVHVIGASLWCDIQDAIQDPRHCYELEYLVVEIMRRERSCPQDLLPYVLNLRRYLTSLLQQNR